MTTRRYKERLQFSLFCGLMSLATASAQPVLDQPQWESPRGLFNVIWAEFTPDGSEILASGVRFEGTPPEHQMYGYAVIYDAETGLELSRIDTGLESVRQFRRSKDGTKYLTCGSHRVEGGHADLWDASSGAHLLRIDHTTTDLLSADLSPDGTRIVTAGQSLVRMVNASNGQLIRQFGHESFREAMFSPDGKMVAGVHGQASWELVLWESDTGSELRRFPSYGYYAVFSPNGSRIMGTGLGSGAYELFDVENGDLIRTFWEPSGEATRPAFSLDGRTVLIPGLQTAKAFDIDTGRELASLQHGDGDLVFTASFAADGQSVATGIWRNNFGNGYMALWKLPVIPILSIHRSGVGSVTLTWEDPSGSPAYVLQQCPDLSVGNWESVSVSTPGQHEVADPSGTMFFRLMEP